MKIHQTTFATLLLLPMSAVYAGEMGTGGEDDPHAAPTEPTTSESTGGGFFDQLTEWFELDSNDSE